jgi:hypothetical protein
MGLKRNIPKRPRGTDPLSILLANMWDRLYIHTQFNDSPTVTVREGQKGYSFDAAAASGGGGAPYLQQYYVIEVEDNYLVCGQLTGPASPITGLQLTGVGSGFTAGTHALTFTGGGGTGATGTYTAAVVGGSTVVTALTITDGGTGYTSNPTVGFSGGGSGATAFALIGTYYVALPLVFQRRAYDGATIFLPDGQHTFAYQSGGYRTDTTPNPAGGSPIDADSFIWPPYLATSGATPQYWSLIEAYEPEGGTGLSVDDDPVIYQAIGGGRMWMNVNQICYATPDGNVAAYMMAPSNPSATEG